MTDRYHSFIVVLQEDIREDDAQPIIDALRMIKGVLTVKPNTSDVASAMAQARVRHEFIDKMLDALKEF